MSNSAVNFDFISVPIERIKRVELDNSSGFC